MHITPFLLLGLTIGLAGAEKLQRRGIPFRGTGSSSGSAVDEGVSSGSLSGSADNAPVIGTGSDGSLIATGGDAPATDVGSELANDSGMSSDDGSELANDSGLSSDDNPRVDGSGLSNDDNPRVGGMGSGADQWDDAASETDPQYLPASEPNECLRETCAELTVEVAKQVLEQVVRGDPSSSTGRNNFGPEETQTRFPAVTGAPATTAFPVPNADVAETMTLDQSGLALFDQEEQDMYFNDRLCFYANVERQYASVATATPSPTRLARRQNAIDEIQSQQQDATSPTTTTRIGGVASRSAEYELWQTMLPNNLLDIYQPAATNNGSMTTATTTCSGLGDAGPITMSYVEARATPTPTATNDNLVEGAANTRSAAGGPAVFGAVVAFVGLVII